MSAPSILIVDDDPDFLEIAKAILETKQYQVRSAQNPDEGFAKLEEEIPDLLILDIMMGRGAGGFVLARKIRKDSRFDHVPIMMLTSMTEQTGFNFPGERISDKFLPVDDYIEKGIKPHALLEKVELLLARKNVN
ncbi:MAG TPA: response regulator [Sedimentisphaerales bacterium]|nr:response regulator [Sedimentisphaerales bacterium]